MVSSKACDSPLSRIKVSLFLLSICTDELISVPKIMTFYPMLSSVNKILNENEIICCSCYLDQYLYLSRSAFLVNFTDPNKQLCNVKPVFEFLNHGFSV